MSRHTVLYDEHVRLGGKLVNFAGWDMPLNYGSQMEEHHAVRQSAGAFDVSHMTVIDVSGDDAERWLRYLIANDVGVLDAGQAQYGLLLNQEAGIIDDLIAYKRDMAYRLIVNAGTRDTVLEWMGKQQGEYQVSWIHRSDLAIIAVQGPKAISMFQQVTGIDCSDMPAFSFLDKSEDSGKHNNWMIARTGYTGEAGLELVLPEQDAPALWQDLMEIGVNPVGLAARDTLRLEAGMSLSGQDMDENTHALESNLGWTIAWKPETRNFIGRDTLAAIREKGSALKLTGVTLEGRGVLRHGQKIFSAVGEGIVTSGIFSPTLGYSIGLARLPRSAVGSCEVEIRNKRLPVKIVRPPFVRNGQKVIK